MKRILLKTWYFGTFFFGSQEQVDKRTVEGELIRALIKTKYISNRQDNKFRTAGRTDAGVHAQEAVFCFNTPQKFYVSKLETFLPEDMGVIQWAEVALDFHPRFEAISKEYRYAYPKTAGEILDIVRMQEAANIMEGTHDFRLFSKTNYSNPDQKTIITLDKVEITDFPDHIEFIFKSRSFLWQQIRRTVAFLLKIGTLEKTKDDLLRNFEPEVIKHSMGNREKPIGPEGLTLVTIEFAQKWELQDNPKGRKRQQEFCQKHAKKLKQEVYSLDAFINP